jgi:hypothetical protein
MDFSAIEKTLRAGFGHDIIKAFLLMRWKKKQKGCSGLGKGKVGIAEPAGKTKGPEGCLCEKEN